MTNNLISMSAEVEEIDGIFYSTIRTGPFYPDQFTPEKVKLMSIMMREIITQKMMDDGLMPLHISTN